MSGTGNKKSERMYTVYTRMEIQFRRGTTDTTQEACKHSCGFQFQAERVAVLTDRDRTNTTSSRPQGPSYGCVALLCLQAEQPESKALFT